jgi:hypothetical protein
MDLKIISTVQVKLPIILFAIFLSTTPVFSQKGDYKLLRDSIPKLSCKPVDSLTVVATKLELEKIDTNLFDKNLDIYFRDLGWSHYRLYLYTKDTSLIRSSIENYKKADAYKPGEASTFWQLSFLHYLLGDCASGKYYLEKYKGVTDKQYWREDQIKRMTMGCNN